MSKIKFLWQELTGSFWFIPILIIIASIGLATLLIYIDRSVDVRSVKFLNYILTESADSARSVLSTISGAMIGVAGTVFSITLVALTLASSQFGPRLLKNFMHERLNQVVLGTYVSTYAYCLIVLNVVKDNEAQVFIPSLSILLAILAAIGNIILLIIFIHSISISIQADHVVSDISVTLMKNIERIFSEELEDEDPSFEKNTKPLDHYLKDFSYSKTLQSSKSGYLQYLHNISLFEAAKANEYLIVSHYRVGGYIVKGEPIISVHSKTEFTEDSSIDFESNYVLGSSRTTQQDAEHSIHQMVEIACRALSPGINDPFTAISCIDNLTSTLCYLTRVKFPSKYKFDDDKLRYAFKPLTFQGMLDAAFLQIRQFSKGSPAVVIRLMEAMIKIHDYTSHKIHKKAVKEHAEMVLKVAEDSFEESHDLEDMRERSRKILKNS
ncbi:DUF2254 domain-containing protein [Psychroflexus sp. CAK57W]|uniref:DUF2254 domain-containing protein n=1 Tax=Psychroflexus curvus TaxID=2873595 RepID=UPI001CCA950B|nr:DUF2254 domain-containing protein [Psychroflexus curvus]MBZ9626870.1 DUF2254 domain-containing protein [Psychroflexus curvus]MBZ9786644.1 DUF2254 domain-containing protein [Psychroflexus curvus]